MAYSPPKIQFYQQFERALTSGVTPLYATIVGPLYGLHRFSEEDEQAKLGEYDRETEETYAWPDHVAGAEVVLSEAQVKIKNALLQYFQDDAAGNLTADNGNKVECSSLVFKTNDYASRSAAFGDRDVQSGDRVWLNWNDPVTGDPESLKTVLASLEAGTVAGTTSPDSRWSTNFGDTTQTADESLTYPAPSKYTVAYDASGYDGLAAGYPEDVYTIRVLATGTGGSRGLDGTKLRISSAGGDPAVEVTLGEEESSSSSTSSSSMSSSSSSSTSSSSSSSAAAGNYDIDLGSRGATMTIADSGGGSVSAGNFWQVTIAQTYTEVDLDNAAQYAIAGPYTGDENTQYSLTITSGGTVGTDDITIGYATNDDADSSGTISAEAADFPPSSVDYAVGTKGMTLTLVSGTEYNTGDVIVFDVEAQQDGAYRTLVLQDAVPTTTAADLDVAFLVSKEATLKSDYFTAAADDITIDDYAGVDDDLLGTTQEFELHGGTLYADYRELRADLANTLGVTDGLDSVTDDLGPAVAENPLSLAVYLARLNSNATEVYYMPVESEDQTGYTEAFDALTEYSDEVYGIVALTDGLDAEESIKDDLKAHVSDQSDSENNQWRRAWFANNTPKTEDIYTEDSAGDALKATVSEHGSGLYRKVTVTNGLLLTNGVQAGDTLRINFVGATYDSYTIDRVTAEDECILVSGPSAAITVAVKVEFWRTFTKSGYAEELKDYPTKFGNRRLLSVYMDGPEDADGNSLDLMYVCAALSGLRSGGSPHAPLSEVELDGIYSEPQQNFTKAQLNTIASGGNWIVVKDFDGRVYTRHQVTTGIAVPRNEDDLMQQEDSFTSNADDICRAMYPRLNSLVGRSNVSDELLALIRQEWNSVNEGIRNRPYSATLGSQIVDAELTRLRVHPTHRDTVQLEGDYDLPAPLNDLQVVFTFGPA